MVEREGYAFYVSFEFDRLPLFCTKCHCIRHEEVACPHAGFEARNQDNQNSKKDPRKSAVMAGAYVAEDNSATAGATGSGSADHDQVGDAAAAGLDPNATMTNAAAHVVDNSAMADGSGATGSVSNDHANQVGDAAAAGLETNAAAAVHGNDGTKAGAGPSQSGGAATINKADDAATVLALELSTKNVAPAAKALASTATPASAAQPDADSAAKAVNVTSKITIEDDKASHKKGRLAKPRNARVKKAQATIAVEGDLLDQKSWTLASILDNAATVHKSPATAIVINNAGAVVHSTESAESEVDSTPQGRCLKSTAEFSDAQINAYLLRSAAKAAKMADKASNSS
uniref:Zinc knuckle CX2CX4HX4C domain-containing protein n=1 Tax=Cajanus cajan TaxID=3821 RepID=A0A151RN79_CAJCA|nr:hypothetical protein KK1_034573 [Cajanus cajan]